MAASTANKARPRILFVTRRFPPTTGGMEQYAYDLYSSLKGKADIYLIKWGAKSRLWVALVLPYFFVRSFWALLTTKIDIIHMQDGLLSVMGAVLKIIFRKPLCVVIHGLDVTYQNGLYQTLVPWALKRADYVFCISNSARDEVVKRGVDDDKAVVIPLGITDELCQKDHRTAKVRVRRRLGMADNQDRIILSVGRLVERKGVHWFINQIMPKLLESHPNVMFAIAGEGSFRSSIEQAIKNNKLENRVKLLGRVDDKYLRDLYNGADLFVMPNIPVRGDMEGFGRVLLEASLCELPIVASGIEGISDAVTDGRNGILVPAQDAASCLKAVERFLSDAVYARKFGSQSRKFTLKEYGWDKISDQFITRYRSLANW